VVELDAEDEKVMTESGTGRLYAVPFAVNWTVAPLTVMVAPVDGTPLTFITLLNQMESPAAMPVPLKFDVMVLMFGPEALDGAGGTGTGER
jgi:hypothetical protein